MREEAGAEAGKPPQARYTEIPVGRGSVHPHFGCRQRPRELMQGGAAVRHWSVAGVVHDAAARRGGCRQLIHAESRAENGFRRRVEDRVVRRNGGARAARTAATAAARESREARSEPDCTNCLQAVAETLRPARQQIPRAARKGPGSHCRSPDWLVDGCRIVISRACALGLAMSADYAPMHPKKGETFP